MFFFKVATVPKLMQLSGACVANLQDRYDPELHALCNDHLT